MKVRECILYHGPHHADGYNRTIPGLSGLHDLHPTGRLVDGESPLVEDRLELVPVNDVESVVVTLGELDSLGSFDLSGLQSFLLGNNLCP